MARTQHDPFLETVTKNVVVPAADVRRAARKVATGVPKEKVGEILGMLGILDPLKTGTSLNGDTELFVPSPGQPGGYVDPKSQVAARLSAGARIHNRANGRRNRGTPMNTSRGF